MDDKTMTAVERLAEADRREAISAAAKAKVEAETKAERELANREIFAGYVEIYGEDDIRRVDTMLGMVVIREAPQGIYRIFRRLYSETKTRDQALEKLTSACLLHPASDEFDAWIRKKAAILDLVGNACVEFSGLQTEGNGSAS